MAAVFKQIWVIDPSVDLTGHDAETQMWEFNNALEPSVNQSRLALRNQMVAEGKTSYDAFKCLLDIPGRRYLRAREFVNIAAAEEFATWQDEIIGNTVPIPGPVQYTLSSQTVMDNTTLDQVDW